VVFGPIAAGEIVQDSAISAEARWIREHYNDACAIEMEAAGVAQAAHLNDSLPVVVVRGISDRADGGKVAVDGAGWQPRAAANATAFAVALVAALAEELGPDHHRDTRHADDTEHGSSTNSNTAQGNSRVGVQAHTIYGGVWVGPDRGTGPAGATAMNHPGTGPGKLRMAVAWLRNALSDVAGLATGVAAVLTAVRSPT
jgi:8-oxo-dGTP diphosphatase